MTDTRSLTQSQLLDQLRDLGVRAGTTLLVHTAFSRLGPVDGGPLGLISALTQSLGPTGTLVMPSLAEVDDEVFDPLHSPCRGMGIVADTFWRLPGVMRSNNPHAFAARGPAATEILQAHPVAVPHGLDSPVGRILAQDGWVLLLGVDHDANTMVHLAENLAGVTYGIPKYSLVHEDEGVQRVDYLEVTHCCLGFRQLNPVLDERWAQCVGPVGQTTARLARAIDVVEAALSMLKVQEDVFLHPKGDCEECDDARSGMVRAAPIPKRQPLSHSRGTA